MLSQFIFSLKKYWLLLCASQYLGAAEDIVIDKTVKRPYPCRAHTLGRQETSGHIGFNRF